MRSDRDVVRTVRSWLEEGVTALPDHVLDAVLDQVPATPQRRAWWPAWSTRTNAFAIAATAAAVVIVVIVGLSLLPSSPRAGEASPSPLDSPSPQLSPSPSGESGWPPPGPLEVGRHDVSYGGIAFSFEVPDGWRRNYDFPSMIEKGTYPTSGAYVTFDLDGTALRVFADPCAHGLGPPIDASASALAEAMMTIPGTDAVGPLDTIVGGLPAKLVELTFRDGIECGPREFALYGVSEDSWWFPDSLDSTIRDWILEVDFNLGTGPNDIGRKRVVIHTDQRAPSDNQIVQEIQGVVDSIRFK